MERKDYILDLLYKNSERWISGEEISNILDISRTAVWKYINNLRETGYIIESSSKNGHRLISPPDRFTIFEIRKRLKTELFGRREIYIFDQTDSSNIQAFNFAAGGAEEGSIVIAECQTGGKGRLGRKWISPSNKNLYLSLIVRPHIPPYAAPRLTLVTAVALSETLNIFHADNHKIKWPNDILFNGKKLAGILTEMKADCDSIDFIIIGAGVNLNSTPDDYPDSIKDIAVSLKEITGNKTDRVEFLNSFLLSFENVYSEFLNGGFGNILSRWTERSSIINQKIKVTDHDDIFTGTVTGVTQDGNLLVYTGKETRQVNSGDINYLKDSEQ